MSLAGVARIVEIEEVEVGAAAVQNMLLAAHSLGLAAMWRTGDAAYDPAVRSYLGLSERGHILGFIYVGYAAIEKSGVDHVAIPGDRVAWLGLIRQMPVSAGPEANSGNWARSLRRVWLAETWSCSGETWGRARQPLPRESRGVSG